MQEVIVRLEPVEGQCHQVHQPVLLAFLWEGRGGGEGGGEEGRRGGGEGRGKGREGKGEGRGGGEGREIHIGFLKRTTLPLCSPQLTVTVVVGVQ